MCITRLTTRRMILATAAATVTVASLAGRRPAKAAAASRHPFGRPLVFAHRGSSGERPEHTLAAYKLAMQQGADFIELDLRLTKDGVFICLHDPTLERTTDIASRPEFAGRAKPDKKGVLRWHAADFTLAETKTLKCRQGHAGRPADFDGRDGIPTFAEIVELVRAHNAAHRTRVGITPELKNGDVARFLEFVRKHELEAGGRAGAAVPLHVQSFDLATVVAVRSQLVSPCVWLVSKRPDEVQLAEVAGRIDGISIAKDALLADDPAAYCARLHAAGYCVVSWTFADDMFDAKRFTSADDELAAALAAGVDALFTDFPASAAAARDRFVAGR